MILLYIFSETNLIKMARTPTTQIPLGFKAPEFKLPNVVDNQLYGLKDLAKKWFGGNVYL